MSEQMWVLMTTDGRFFAAQKTKIIKVTANVLCTDDIRFACVVNAVEADAIIEKAQRIGGVRLTPIATRAIVLLDLGGGVNNGIAETLVPIYLANAFSRNIRATLSPSQLRLTIKRNRFNKDSSCATHDFCDANEMMAQAFNQIVGREISVQDGQDMCCVNTAWDIAKTNEFKPYAPLNIYA